MHLYIDRDKLLGALALAASVAPTKGIGPASILPCVVLRAEDGALIVSASDTVLLYRERVEARVVARSEGLCTDAQSLLRGVKTLPRGTVEIEEGARGRLIVKSGSTRLTRATLPIEDYPELGGGLQARGEFTVDATELARLLERVAPSVCTNDDRHGINGMHFEEVEGRLRAAGTDGHTLSHDEGDVKGEIVVPERMLVSRAGVDELRKLLASGSGDACVAFGELSLTVTLGDRQLVQRLLDGEFPAYRKVMPARYKREVVIDRRELHDALRPHLATLRSTVRPIRLDLDAGRLTLSSRDPETSAEARSELAVDLEGNPLAIGLNPAYLERTLRQVGSETVKLCFTDPLGPMEVASEDADDRARFIVMPMRID